MSGQPITRMSQIPGFDPRKVPIASTDSHLAPVPFERLRPHALRHRFTAPPIWTPEFTGDGFNLTGKAPRAAAVLIPIVDHAAGPTVLLTQRTAHLKEHAGQVAFPGGRTDPGDHDAVYTALREAQEEVGLPGDRVDVIGGLPHYYTGTGYQIEPVVGVIEPGFIAQADPAEVDAVFEVPLAFLMDPSHHHRHNVRWGTYERSFYSMPWRAEGEEREFFIWGATAAMLRNLYRLLSA